MVEKNIINKLGLSEDKLNQQVSEIFGEQETRFLEEVLQTKVDSRLPGTILKGTIVSQIGNDVIVEVGLKSEVSSMPASSTAPTRYSRAGKSKCSSRTRIPRAAWFF